MREIKDLKGWVDFLDRAEIPVLRQTQRDLAVLQVRIDSISARDVTEVISRDPMMTVNLLSYLQSHKHRKQEHEVVQVEQALLLLGVGVFFNKLPAKPLVEELLRGQTQALINFLHVVHRSHRASEYAFDWAVRLRDTHYEEVRIAALLHDLAEMLMWCFAPQSMLQISALQQQDKTLRSRIAQEQVLGFALVDLQLELVRAWSLPRLLLDLISVESAIQPRTRNVILAVNLARHSSKGWDDAALPDDYTDIGKLLTLPAEEVKIMLGAEAGTLCDIGEQH